MVPAPISDQSTPSSNDIPTPKLPSPQAFDLLVTLNALLHRLLADPPLPDNVQQTASVAIKDYATEALKVKSSLNQARVALQGLPDLDRSILQQEAEIRRLEMAVLRKKSMLRRIGGVVGGKDEAEE